MGDEIYSKENRRPSIVSWATILEVRRPRLSWPTILKKQGDDFCKIVAQERDYKRQRFGTLTILSLSLSAFLFLKGFRSQSIDSASASQIRRPSASLQPNPFPRSIPLSEILVLEFVSILCNVFM